MPLSVTGPTVSQRIRARIGLATPALTTPYARLNESAALGTRYADYLVFLHTVVRASVPLMVDAVTRLSAMPPDPLADGLRSYLDHHVPEEAGHEEWLLQDLEVLGCDRDDALGRVPSPHVAGAVGAQYYWIRHHHPVALLGYIAVLEGQPPTTARVREWRRRTGLPQEAFRTLEHHAAVDPSHNEELDRLLDALPLSEAHVTCICLNGMATAISLGRALDDVAG